MKVYLFQVELSCILQAKKVTRKNSIVIGCDDPSKVTLEELNRPENLHRAIPGFITGKIREMYRVSKIISYSGPVGLDQKEAGL